MITKDGYIIYESKINKGAKEVFETKESISTFHHNSFLEQIKNEMIFYEMNIESLSKSINISHFRLSALLNGRAEFELHEIDLIKRRLHL